MRYAAKWPEYAKQWDTMVIKPNRVHEFEATADKLIRNKPRYLEVAHALELDAKAGNMYWWHIALLHKRESNADFSTYLGNGQSLARRTTIVPKGRGPFTGPDAFKKGCLDALAIDGLDAVLDWRLEKILYYCELFNGAGYDMHGLPSPYIFGGTNIQKAGKYVADGPKGWSAGTWDVQPGCAPILWMMAKHDPSIVFVRES